MNKKQEHFCKTSEARMNKIVHLLRLLGNCSRTAYYDYNDDQVERIFRILETEIAKAKERFLKREKYREASFSLGEYGDKSVPSIDLPLPDGTTIRASAIDDCSYPAINIYLLVANSEPEKICFAEYNPEREREQALCIGVYHRDCEYTAYYDSYTAKEVTE